MKGSIMLTLSVDNGDERMLTSGFTSPAMLSSSIEEIRKELHRIAMKYREEPKPASEPASEPAPDPAQPAPEEKKHPSAYKTRYRLHCNTCNSTYMKAILNTQQTTECSCGESIDLTDAADFEYSCPQCGEIWFGKATTYEPNFTMMCGKCRTKSMLRWDKNKKMYVGG